MRLIDADALLDKFEWKVTSPLYIRIIRMTIEAAPTIDAVKHGRWIRTTKADYAWECSACGYGLCDNRTTYCYDCGARMDGEREEE